MCFVFSDLNLNCFLFLMWPSLNQSMMEKPSSYPLLFVYPFLQNEYLLIKKPEV